MFQHLPAAVKRQLIDYLEFLLDNYTPKTKKKKNFSFSWRGGLSDLKSKYTSVELQHEANKWR
ncbi:MAG: DUF2281 domain-containing protein [Bacteroidetes bacterium]|nr:MAG: DUF2281 domain-containing protein [Bacteroidota bacterium]